MTKGESVNPRPRLENAPTWIIVGIVLLQGTFTSTALIIKGGWSKEVMNLQNVNKSTEM
jgi:hypothetical protein